MVQSLAPNNSEINKNLEEEEEEEEEEAESIYLRDQGQRYIPLRLRPVCEGGVSPPAEQNQSVDILAKNVVGLKSLSYCPSKLLPTLEEDDGDSDDAADGDSDDATDGDNDDATSMRRWLTKVDTDDDNDDVTEEEHMLKHSCLL